MFKRRLLAGLVIAVAVVSTVSSLNAAATVSPAMIDVGVIAPGSSNQRKITLTNSNSSSIKLLGVDVECTTCTKVEFSPTTLEAGKSVEIQVTFKPPPGDTGRINRTITIRTDDPRAPAIVVALNAYVTASAGFWPMELSVAKPSAPGSDIDLPLELVNVSDKPVTPLYATGPVEGPKLSVPHTPIPPGGRVKIPAKWHLPAKAGEIGGQLILYVDHPALTQLVIPYHAVVQSSPPSPAAPAASSRADLTGRGEPSIPQGTMAAVNATESSPPIQGAATRQAPEFINLDLKENIPLRDFVDIAATQLKLNLIYDEAALNVPVSIRLSGPLPVDAVLPLLKTLLQAKGLALVPTDRQEIWRIVTSREAQSLSEPGRMTGTEGPTQIVTEFITPKSVDIETAAGLLRGFLTPNVGQLTTVPRVKAMIVTDYASQMGRLQRLMDLIDKPQVAAKVEIVPLHAAEAGPLADRVTKLLVQIAKAEGRAAFENVFVTSSEEAGAGAGIVIVGPESELPRVTALIKQFDTAPSLMRVDYQVSEQQRAQALEAIRQVLGPFTANTSAGADGQSRVVTSSQGISVLATEGQQRRVKDLLAAITGSDGDGSGIQLKAYHIQNRDAAEIYSTLTRLMGDNRGLSLNPELGSKLPNSIGNVTTDGVTRVGSMPGDSSHDQAPGSQPATTASRGLAATNITIDQGTNTLLIAANAASHRRLQSLIAELDRKQAQVLLEVMLVAVADSNTFAAAVDAALKVNVGGATVGIGTDAGIGGGDFIKGRTPSEALGLNAAIFNPASFSVFLRALQQTNKARITSAPQVLALDNKAAVLRSTQQEPFTSVNASSTVATTSFGGFAEAGTTLELTPHIAPADYLNLEYRLEVSSFTGSSTAAGVPPPRRSDAITSFVSVPDGSTVVVGGLRSSNVSSSVSKVPGLGEIPILGWLGKSQNDTNNTAVFYVFVRPTILRASKFEDLKAVSTPQMRAAGVADGYPVSKARFIGN